MDVKRQLLVGDLQLDRNGTEGGLLEQFHDARAALELRLGFGIEIRAELSESRELAELLMKYGGDPTLKNDEGKSTITFAREKGHAEFADWLEKRR